MNPGEVTVIDRLPRTAGSTNHRIGLQAMCPWAGRAGGTQRPSETFYRMSLYGRTMNNIQGK